MKRKWLGLALAAAMACAGAATAAEYTDSSANYAEGWDNGSNGGTGFMPWKIAANSGSGWAGGGIWETGKAEVSGDVVDANGNAFGIIGKGEGSSFTASRNFRASLAVGDSFEFDMAVNWDCGENDQSKKGIALLLGGEDAIVINHDHFPGPMSVNGFTNAPALANYGTGTMHWTILAKDETTVTVTGTARDGVSEPYSADITLSSSALTGFRLQSALQKTDDPTQEDADKRQSYFNNFKLTIARELPSLQNLTLSEKNSTWAITSADEKQLTFVVGRDTTAGEVTVDIKSSSDFVTLSSSTVVFADGENSAEVSATAKLSGNGNVADITVEAAGYVSPEEPWSVKGPSYQCNAQDDQWQLDVDATCPFYVNNWQSSWFPGDDSLITVASADESVVTVAPLADWAEDTENPHTYASWTVTAVAGGKADVEVFYDGVKVGNWGFEVIASGATLSGPTAMHIGDVATYKLDVTLAGDIESDTFQLVADDDSLVSIDPPVAQELTESGTLEFKVTALAEGEVMLSVVDDEGLDANISPITVAITEAPDYSDYIAYDDASFYSEGFDFSATGVGVDGFGPWGIYKDSAEFGGAFVGTDAGGFPAILTEGQTFGIYANGSNPDYAIYRPFVTDGETGLPKSLEPGQKASVEFVVPESTGVLYAQFARVWEGVPYSRFEVYVDNYNVGVNVNGAAGNEALSWSAEPRRIVASIQRAADGSDYTLNLVGYNESGDVDVFQHVVNADVGEWYDGIQGIVIGVYNMGGGENMPFNKLAVTQEEEPVKVRAIGFSEATYNPDVAEVPYKFAIGATTDDIGQVNLSVTPDDGGLVLSAASVDLTGTYEAEFSVTVSAEAIPAEGEGTKYTITATPVDGSVAAATYDVTPRAPYIYLSSDNWEYDDDQGAIWVSVHATPSHFGTYYVTVDPAEGVLGIPELSQTIEINAANQDACAFDLTVVGAGEANVYIAHEGALDPSADFHFLIHSTVDPSDEPTIDGTTVVNVKFSNGFSAKATGDLEAEYTGVKAQRLKWNGSRDSGFEPVGEELVNQATWPEMKFDLDDPNAVLRFIFVK